MAQYGGEDKSLRATWARSPPASAPLHMLENSWTTWQLHSFDAHKDHLPHIPPLTFTDIWVQWYRDNYRQHSTVAHSCGRPCAANTCLLGQYAESVRQAGTASLSMRGHARVQTDCHNSPPVAALAPRAATTPQVVPHTLPRAYGFGGGNDASSVYRDGLWSPWFRAAKPMDPAGRTAHTR